MISQFIKMHTRSVQSRREFESSMHLDVSKNALGDDSLKLFAELLSKFEGFRSVSLVGVRSKMSKKDQGYGELAKALKENRSLVELDLRENEIFE